MNEIVTRWSLRPCNLVEETDRKQVDEEKSSDSDNCYEENQIGYDDRELRIQKGQGRGGDKEGLLLSAKSLKVSLP